MSTAPSMLASVPVDLLSITSHHLRWNVAGVLCRLAARAAVEQASDHPAYPLSRQLAVLLHTSRRRFARSAAGMQQCVAASITRHHPEAP
ncbi:hypothetical protein FHT09_002152 [Xanthomonas arboricola]|nr:hypothetical protein [Xanthomonas sp. CFBP 8152]